MVDLKRRPLSDLLEPPHMRPVDQAGMLTGTKLIFSWLHVGNFSLVSEMRSPGAKFKET